MRGQSRPTRRGSSCNTPRHIAASNEGLIVGRPVRHGADTLVRVEGSYKTFDDLIVGGLEPEADRRRPRAGVRRARPPRAAPSGTRQPASAASPNAATRGHRRATAQAPRRPPQFLPSRGCVSGRPINRTIRPPGVEKIKRAWPDLNY